MKEKNEYKEKIYKGFLEKYPHIHPQIIFVTLDMASSVGRAFDLLEDWKVDLPVRFDIEEDAWVPDTFEEYDFIQGEI